MIDIKQSENKLYIVVEENTYVLPLDKKPEIEHFNEMLQDAKSPEEYNEFVDTIQEKLEDLNNMSVFDTDSKYFMSKAGDLYLHYNGTMTDIVVPKAFYNFIRAYKDSDAIGRHIMWLLRNPMFVDKRFGYDKEGIYQKLHNYATYVTRKYTVKSLYDRFIKEGLTPELALEQSQRTQVSINEDGMLNLYKVATPLLDNNEEYDEEEDSVIFKNKEEKKYAEEYEFIPCLMGYSGDAFYSDEELGHIIRIGNLHYLPEEHMVDHNDYHSCVEGLHSGNKQYLKTWETGDDVTLNIIVNPMEYRAVSQGEHVMRVKSYLVSKALRRNYINQYFVDKTKLTNYSNEQWDFLQAETVMFHTKEIDKIKKEIDFINKL